MPADWAPAAGGVLGSPSGRPTVRPACLSRAQLPASSPKEGGKGLFQMEANERSHVTLWWWWGTLQGESSPGTGWRQLPAFPSPTLPRDLDEFF